MVIQLSLLVLLLSFNLIKSNATSIDSYVLYYLYNTYIYSPSLIQMIQKWFLQ